MRGNHEDEANARIDPEYKRITERGLQALRDSEAHEDAQAGPRLADTPPPVPPAKLTPEQKAESLEANIGAVYLYSSSGMSFGPSIDLQTLKVYVDRFIQNVGNPTDPIERMLLEQLVMAHHAIGKLNTQAGSTKIADEAAACFGAAARLMGEFRRHALAHQAYRAAATKRAEPEPQRHPETPPEKNGLASNGTQRNGMKKPPDTELESNGRIGGFVNARKPELATA